MKKEFGTRHVIDMFFVITLLFLFVLSALMLIALGSSIYSRSVSVMQDNYDSRTAYAYITEKLRQYDSTGSISSADFHNQEALRIESNIEDTDYVTYLYEYEGFLMELIARADAGDIPPEQGQKIMEIDSMSVISEADGLMEITVILPDEKEITFVTSQRSTNNKET